MADAEVCISPSLGSTMSFFDVVAVHVNINGLRINSEVRSPREGESHHATFPPHLFAAQYHKLPQRNRQLPRSLSAAASGFEPIQFNSIQLINGQINLLTLIILSAPSLRMPLFSSSKKKGTPKKYNPLLPPSPSSSFSSAAVRFHNAAQQRVVDAEQFHFLIRKRRAEGQVAREDGLRSQPEQNVVGAQAREVLRGPRGLGPTPTRSADVFELGNPSGKDNLMNVKGFSPIRGRCCWTSSSTASKVTSQQKTRPDVYEAFEPILSFAFDMAAA